MRRANKIANRNARMMYGTHHRDAIGQISSKTMESDGEVMSLARAAKVDLCEADIDNWYAVLSGLSPQGKTSMLQDIEARRKTEVEMFAGKVIELGKTYGLSTPVNLMIFRLIKVIEQYTD